MDFIDEKDYIMRLIKEAVRVLFSLMLGKQYNSVELQEANKYEVSGDTLAKYERMVDEGFINEAENILLEGIDYAKKEEVLMNFFSLTIALVIFTFSCCFRLFLASHARFFVMFPFTNLLLNPSLCAVSFESA